MTVKIQPRVKNNKTRFSPTLLHDEFSNNVEAVRLDVSCIERLFGIRNDILRVLYISSLLCLSEQEKKEDGR